VQNAVKWSATSLFGLLLCVPVIGQSSPSPQNHKTRPRILDSRAPGVSITSPGNSAQVSDIITITADASDNVGVSSVQFYADGSAIGLADFQAPYGVN